MIKKYLDFIKINENSSDDIDNFIDKLNFINDNYTMSDFCAGNIKIIEYTLPEFRSTIDELYDSIKKEIELYDFDYHIIDIERYKNLIITIIPKNFIKENGLETFTHDDMKTDKKSKSLKLWRFRKELETRTMFPTNINKFFFSCVYGEYIRDFEIMCSNYDPGDLVFNTETIETANIHFLDWQYKIKNNL